RLGRQADTGPIAEADAGRVRRAAPTSGAGAGHGRSMSSPTSSPMDSPLSPSMSPPVNPMVAQVRSLPALIRELFPVLDDAARRTLDHRLCLSVKRLFVTGCGDSHHASLGAELALEALTGRPVEPMSALQFARYGAGYLPPTGPGTNL